MSNVNASDSANAPKPAPAPRARPKPVTLTDAAAERVRQIIAKSEGKATMLKISVDSKGCSGHSYVLDYANEAGKFDELVEDKGVKILIDPKAALFIFGTEIDYVTEKLKSGFTFSNPNEKGRCGCGESFSV